MTTKKYTTKVASYGLFEGEHPVLGIEVPYEFVSDLGLVANELLEWEIDDETKVATIKKTNIIIND